MDIYGIWLIPNEMNGYGLTRVFNKTHIRHVTLSCNMT